MPKLGSLPINSSAVTLEPQGVSYLPVELNEASYERPEDWLELPTISEGSQEFVGLIAITNDDMNYVALSAAADYTVDWGDGTTENVSSGISAQHLYNYSGLSEGSLCSRGYKQAIVRVTPQDGNELTSLDLHVRHSLLSTIAYETRWLDIAISSSSLSTLVLGKNTRTVSFSMLERLYLGDSALTNCAYLCKEFYRLKSANLVGTGLVENFSDTFRNCTSLVDVSVDTSSGSSFLNMFAYCETIQQIPEIDTSSGTNFEGMFSYCQGLSTIPTLDMTSAQTCYGMLYRSYGFKTLPALDTSSCTNFGSMFYYCISLREVLGLDTSAGTETDSIFNSCESLMFVPDFDFASTTDITASFFLCCTLRSVNLLNTSSITDFGYLFSGCYSLVHVNQFNASSAAVYSGWSELGSAFSYCPNLSRATLLGVKKSISYYFCNLSTTEIVNVFNNLDTADPDQTIWLGGNPGTAALTPEQIAIATGKGWEVVTAE